jgi:hypothetical protein
MVSAWVEEEEKRRVGEEESGRRGEEDEAMARILVPLPPFPRSPLPLFPLPHFLATCAIFENT